MSRHTIPLGRRSAAYKASVGALALATVLGLSACGGGGEDSSTTAAQSDTGAAASAGAGAASAGGATATGDAAGGDDHDMSGMDMSAEEHANMDHSEMTFPELEKEANIPASARFNYQDVYFSQHMIAHHGQAVEMAEMLAANTKNPEMKKLAKAIHDAQAPEIKLMTGWLTSWKQSTENAPHAHDPKAPPAGMMTDEDMAKLHAAKGKAFDRLFLAQMIAHHTGAVNQSNKEVSDGKFPAAIKLAKAIIAAQTKEIALMKKLQKTV